MSPRPVNPADGTAWITGASAGIGRATALELARRGYKVAATARSARDLAALEAEAAAAGLTVKAYAGDVTDAARMAEIVNAIEADLGPLALAVLNAGIYLPVRAQAFDLGAFATSFRVNLDGTAACLAPTLKAMGGRGRGQIALVSSVAGYRGLPTSAAYGATKAGLINMAESLKFDTDNMGIKLQVVNPGFVDTGATAKNPFPMPHLMKVEEAARRIADGLGRTGFEITFPRRFTWQLKLLRLLPIDLYLALVARSTGWKGKTD